MEWGRDAGVGIRIKYQHLLCGWGGHSPPASHYPSTRAEGKHYRGLQTLKGGGNERVKMKIKNRWVLVGGTELTGSTWLSWARRLRYRLSAITASTPPEFPGGHLGPNRTPPTLTPYHRSNWSVCICVDERHANFALADFIMRPSQLSFSIYSLSSTPSPPPLTFSNSLSFVTHFT